MADIFDEVAKELDIFDEIEVEVDPVQVTRERERQISEQTGFFGTIPPGLRRGIASIFQPGPLNPLTSILPEASLPFLERAAEAIRPEQEVVSALRERAGFKLGEEAPAFPFLLAPSARVRGVVQAGLKRAPRVIPGARKLISKLPTLTRAAVPASEVATFELLRTQDPKEALKGGALGGVLGAPFIALGRSGLTPSVAFNFIRSLAGGKGSLPPPTPQSSRITLEQLSTGFKPVPPKPAPRTFFTAKELAALQRQPRTTTPSVEVPGFQQRTVQPIQVFGPTEEAPLFGASQIGQKKAVARIREELTPRVITASEAKTGLRPGEPTKFVFEEPVVTLPTVRRQAKKVLTDSSTGVEEKQIVKIVSEQEEIAKDIVTPFAQKIGKVSTGITKTYKDVARKANVQDSKFFARIEEYNKKGMSMEDALRDPEIARVYAEQAIIKNPASGTEPLQKVSRGFWKKIGDKTANQFLRVERQGTNGTEIAKKARQAISSAEQAENTILLVTDRIFKGLSREELNSLRLTLRGRAPAINQRVETAAIELRGVMNDVRQAGKDAGLDIGLLDDYLPQYFNKDLFQNSKVRILTRKKIVESGLARNSDDAERMLREYDSITTRLNDAPLQQEMGNVLHPSNIKRFGSFDFERQITDPRFVDILEEVGAIETNLRRIIQDIYVPSGIRRAAVAREFGPNSERFVQLARNVAAEGGDARYVNEFFQKVVLGKNPTDKAINDAISLSNSVTAMLALGRASIPQMAAISSVFATSSLRSFAKGIADIAFSPRQSLKFARDAGAILRSIARDLQDIVSSNNYSNYTFLGRAAEKSRKAVDVFLTGNLTKFNDNFTRLIGASVGRRYIQESFNVLKSGAKDIRFFRSRSANLKEMKLYFPNVDKALKRGFITNEELSLAVKNFSDEVVGKPTIGRLPAFAATPYGRFFTTLSRTVLGLTGTYNRQIYKPAVDWMISGGKKGTIGPVLKMMGAGQAVGFGIAEARSLLTGRDRKDMSTAAWVLDNFVNASAGGMVLDLIGRAVISRGQIRVPTSKSFLGRVGEFFVPPAVSIGAQTTEAVLTGGEEGRLPATIDLIISAPETFKRIKKKFK